MAFRTLSKSDTNGYCWGIARVVQDSVPEDRRWFSCARRCADLEVEILDPRFHIFHSFTTGGGYRVSNRISKNDILNKSMGNAKESQYVIPSEEGLIFMLLGPEQTPGAQSNVRVRWSRNSAGLVVVTAHEKDRPYRWTVHSSNDASEGWLRVSLPLLRAFGNFPPPRPQAGMPGKTAIEVCTHVQWANNKDWFMQARMEHHLQRRVASSDWWLKPSTAKKTGAQGYSSSNPAVLNRQAIAAKGWMLASAEVMVDSSWAESLHMCGRGRVKLMGFESNNPLHDDHEGKGAHWHLTIRHLAKERRFADTVDPTPHLYFNSKGGIDTSGHFGKQKPAVNCEDADVWRLEAFAAFLNSPGSLSLSPLVALKSERAMQTDSGFLHVRESFARLPRGEQAELHNDDTSRGSTWAIEFLGMSEAGGRVVALRSTRGGGYFHVRKSAPQLEAKWSVFMLHHDPHAIGSKWVLEVLDGGKCRFRSAYRNEYLHVRKTFHDLQKAGSGEQVLQLSSDKSSGSIWHLQTTHAKLLPSTVLGHSYEISVENCKHSQGFLWKCTMCVKRDSSRWLKVRVESDAKIGSLKCVTIPEDNCSRKRKFDHVDLAFDPMTGCVRGSNPPARFYKVRRI